MAAIMVSAVLVCVGALALGQAALRICGVQRWSWLAAPVGLAFEMVVAIPAVHLPGRCATTAALLAVLIFASAAWILREPAMRPPPTGLVAAAPVAALTMVPFASAGDAGILGVSFNNDMAGHLLYAEGYRSAASAAVVPIAPDYPIGPHALAGTLAQGLGIGVELAFVGLTVATAVLLAWTALAALDRVGRLGQILAATVVGMPFLVAAYYGQGAFKELMQAMFVLAVALAFVDRSVHTGPLRWVPLALLAAGALSVYGFLGLPWIAGVAGAVIVVSVARRALSESPREALADVRAEVVPVAIAVAALTVVIAPQIPRLGSFLSRATSVNATGIRKDDIGNLVGRLPLWEAFGTWDNPDFRLPALNGFTAGMWTAFMLALVLLGVAWSIRRGQWALPLAAFVAFAIWFVSNDTQSPYVTAKALVILTPLLLLLAALPLVDRRGGSLPRWWMLLAPLLGAVLVVKVVSSSVEALRFARVGPDDHAAELRSLRPTLDGKPTLFLGNDDFIKWELSGVPVEAPVIGAQRLPFKSPKQWTLGQALDVDSILPEALNARAWVITTRDAAGSAMPPQLELVRETRNYTLWHRTGTVAPREVLPEGDAGGAILDCSTVAGRKIVRRGGAALVRPPSSGVAIPPFAAGTSTGVDLPLAPGTYDLAMRYVSPQSIEVEVVGYLKTLMAANLDRPGPRWPIGRITVPAGSKPAIRIGMYAHERRLTPQAATVTDGSIVATPVGGKQIVAVGEACGKLVDWYRPGLPR